MSLSRKGIFEITDAIEAKLIDAIIVKDLSRLGRHETETASYIEYTRKKEIHIFLMPFPSVEDFRKHYLETI